jgi:hypothetical protein
VRFAVDSELGFTIENDEHFFDGVVEVMTNARARWNLAAMQKVEFGVTAPRLRSAVKDIVPAPPCTAGDGRYAAGSVCTMRCASPACAARGGAT